MAQAKKPQKENEPSGPMSPEQAREFGEQARALNEQILETTTKVGGMPCSVTLTGCRPSPTRSARTSSPQVSEMDWFASILKAQADFSAIRQDGGQHLVRGSGPRAGSPPAATGATHCQVRHR